MAEIRNRDDLEAWLKTQPREVALVIAVRAALRVVPLLGDLRDESGKRTAFVDLATLLRGAFVSWMVARFPDWRLSIDAMNLREAVTTAGFSYSSAEVLGYDAFAVPGTSKTSGYSAAAAAHSLASVVYSLYEPRPNDVAAYASGAVDSAGYAVAWGAATDQRDASSEAAMKATENFWFVVSFDMEHIERGVESPELASMPLWPDDEPNFISEKRRVFFLNQLWFRRRAEQWNHWINWLDDRLHGHPADEEKEIARLTISEAMWEEATKSVEGVKALNAEIRRWFEEIDARRAAESAEAGRRVEEDSVPVHSVGQPETPHDFVEVGGRSSPTTAAPLVFVSYAHKDRAWLEELQSHLGPHLRQGAIELWDDTRLRAGDAWEAEIAAAMRGCRICVLLVSRHALSSDYIARVEMRTILERVASEGVRIFPIVVSPVSIPADHWLRKFNWRPRDGKALVEFPQENGARDAELVRIVDEIVSLLRSTSMTTKAAPSVASGPVAARRPPPAPAPQAGTSFDVGPEGLVREPGPRPAEAAQIALRQLGSLRRSANALVEAAARFENRFPDFARVVSSYAAAVAPEYVDLDLYEVHDIGLSLVSLADVFRAALEAGRDVPDPEVIAELGALAGRHLSFAHRIDEMRDFTVGTEPEARRLAGFNEILGPMHRLLSALTRLRDGLADGTRSHLQAVADGLGEVGAENPEGVRVVYVTLSNALLAIALHFEDVHAAETEGGVALSRLNTKPADTRALLDFLDDQRGDVEVFACPFTKLRLLLAWVYEQKGALPTGRRLLTP